MAQIPNKEPQMNRKELTDLLAKKYPDYEIGIFQLIGIRGYYKKSMGKADGNDRAMYDDAMFILTESDLFAFNANCDPSAYREGIASLVPNVYEGVYKFDNHNGSKGSYPAICQRLGKVEVLRDGKKVSEKGTFGINIHKGGFNSTSSLGCQTIPPAQWDRFYMTAKRLFQKYHGDNWNKESVTYILIEI